MFYPLATRLSRLGATLLACVLACGVAWGDAWIDSHDEPTPVWELEADGVAERLKRERVRLPQPGVATDEGAEQIDYLAPAGYPARFARPTPPAAVIEELRVRARGRSQVPGVSVEAEVVLPRSADEKGNRVRLRIRTRPAGGESGGRFDVNLDRVPQRLAAEARVWRLTNPDRATSLDLRGAFIDRVVLLLPGSGRAARAWISELEVASLVTPAPQKGAVLVKGQQSDRPGQASPASPPGGRIKRTAVTLRSDGFRVDGELFFPRVWRSRGEPFAQLAARGVNTVWLERTPSQEQLDEAALHRLRILCPPPKRIRANEDWQRVLAWVLPGGQGEKDLDAGLVELEAAGELGPLGKRPVLVHLLSGAPAWARLVDGVILDRPGLASETPPGTPLLSTTRLDLAPAVAAQIDTLLEGFVPSVWLPPNEVAASVERALAIESVGLVFTASERIDSADDAAIAASAWLEAINRRLRLIEPWLAGPRSATPTAPDASAVLLRRGGARLALRGPLQSNPVRAAELPNDGSVRPLRLTPAGLSLEANRPGVVGDSLPGDLLIAGDPRVVRSLRRYTARTAAAAAENLRGVAAAALESSAALDEAQRAAAKARLSAARLAISRRDAAKAYDEAYAALVMVTEAEANRMRLSQNPRLLESSPLRRLPSTLTDHFRLTQLLAASPRGPNRLHGGSFEDIDAIRSAGWRRPSASDQGATAELVETESVHGARALRLVSGSGSSAHIAAPGIDLAEGEVVEVTGWLRTPRSAGGGLTIEDSLGGPGIALRVSQRFDEWTPFRLLRAAPSETSLELTLRVDGPITAEIDGLMIRAVEPLGVARRWPAQAK